MLKTAAQQALLRARSGSARVSSFKAAPFLPHQSARSNASLAGATCLDTELAEPGALLHRSLPCQPPAAVLSMAAGVPAAALQARRSRQLAATHDPQRLLNSDAWPASARRCRPTNRPASGQRSLQAAQPSSSAAFTPFECPAPFPMRHYSSGSQQAPSMAWWAALTACSTTITRLCAHPAWTEPS